ncbi:MAG TPA: hypothetical protein VHP35_20020, partial [Terriglobia bacterium]|nr:hypothetical protein [Terriglobia bacterium]
EDRHLLHNAGRTGLSEVLCVYNAHRPSLMLRLVAFLALSNFERENSKRPGPFPQSHSGHAPVALRFSGFISGENV